MTPTVKIKPVLTLSLGGGVELPLQRIPAGEFKMGARGQGSDEEPVHRVQITQAFFMATFPVTQAQWRAVVEQSPQSELNADPSYFKGDLLPVEQVSWEDVSTWCETLQDSPVLSDQLTKLGLTAAQIALPSEAQWEYACRAGTETEYHTGDGEAALATAGWYQGNSKNSTQPVGMRLPNDFGLFDMHGNLWEWCRDAWDAHAYKKRVDGVCDPKVQAAEDAGRVVRGGSWGDSPWVCRAASRDWWWPDYRFRIRGFRVCLFLGPCSGSGGAEPASGGMARRDDAATPQRARPATENSDDRSNAALPSQDVELGQRERPT